MSTTSSPRGVVDSLFPRYLKESGVRAWLAAPTDSARLAEGLRRPRFPEIESRRGDRNRAPTAE